MKYEFSLGPNVHLAPTRDLPPNISVPSNLPDAKEIKVHPGATNAQESNASLFFIGTATCIIEWEGIRIMTDPNFLHAGDHVHLGPGITGTRLTNPAVDLHSLPAIDLVLLSHYHADHFDEKVEQSLRRDLPIITTPHAKEHLTAKGDDSFTNVYDLDVFEDVCISVGSQKSSARLPKIRVIGTPGKHVGDGLLSAANEFLHAVPPTNGWIVELGNGVESEESFECGYRIYISGDTLMVKDLEKIPDYLHGKNVDLMLIHLGGTTIPSPALPLLMVTMDAKQGIELVKLINPDMTIPIHFDDYDVFLSPLADFKKEIEKAGLQNKTVYLDRGDAYKFNVKNRI